MEKEKFNYEAKLWGASPVRLQATYLGALRLKYCLEDLKKIRGKILEVGCGGGGMAKAIKFYRPDLKVYGIDISQKAIKAAQKKAGGVEFMAADAYCLPFRNRFFDGAVSFDLLEHLEAPADALGEIFRVLKPGGLFHSFIPCEGSFFTVHGVLARLGWRAKEKYGGHIQRFTYGELKDILERAKLLPLKRRWSGHLFNQLIDAAYFNWLSWRGRNTPFSVETYLERSRAGFLNKSLQILKETLAFISYFESRFLSWLPGAGVHLTAIKER